ncbi:MAG: hypothetical protein QXP91_09540 [Candidatus Methanomethylicia archaeon]
MSRLTINCRGLAFLSKIMIIIVILGLSTLFLTLFLPVILKPTSPCNGRDIGELIANTMEGSLRSSSSCSLNGNCLIEVSSSSRYEVKIIINEREEIVVEQPKTFIRINGSYEVFNQGLAVRNHTSTPPICISYCVNSSIHVRPLIYYSIGDIEEYSKKFMVLKILIPVLNIQKLKSRAGSVTINFLPENSTVKEYVRFFSTPTSASLIINGLQILTYKFSPYSNYQGLIVRIIIQKIFVNLIGS